MKHLTSQFARVILSAAVVVMLQVGGIAVQGNSPAQDAENKARPVIDEETYDEVLNIVFPRNEPAPGGTVWTIVLRFKPNSGPESQIVIRRGANKAEVIEYTPAGGSIYGTLSEALERGIRRDAVELAKAIKVSRREVSVPHSRVKRWYTSLFGGIVSSTKDLREALEKADNTGAESIVLHGSFYEIWYAQGLNRMSFSLYDLGVEDARYGARYALVRWMKSVRLDVERLKN